MELPGYVIVVDVFGLVLVFVGFNMAFRQPFVRRLLGRASEPPPSRVSTGQEEDPLTYILRIAGVMIMVFGIAIGGMLTLFNLD